MKKLIFVLICLTGISFAQDKWQRWDAKEASYKKEIPHDTWKFEDSSISGALLSSFSGAYKFLISDVDGDNCPFHPTCSSFFIRSVKRSNILQGSLMFADRFMRDSNFFKSFEQYGYAVNGRLYDPEWNYLLAEEKIVFIPDDK